MDLVCQEVKELLKKPEQYIRPDRQLEDEWIRQTKKVYREIKDGEKRYGLAAPTTALPHLDTDGLDNEQLWQLVELQTGPLLATPDNLDQVDETSSLYLSVARLAALARHHKLGPEDEGASPAEDEGIGGSTDDEDEEDEQEDFQPGKPSPDSDMSEGEQDLEEEEDDDGGGLGDEEDMDGDLFDKPGNLVDADLNDVFGDDSDDEEDNFDEFIAPEGREDLSEEEEEEEEVGERTGGKSSRDTKDKEKKSGRDTEKKIQQPKFKKTKVDTQFFMLRESEWIADNDVIGEGFSQQEEEEVDMMADLSDGSETEQGAMYADFFDEVPDEGDQPSKKLSQMLSEEDEEDMSEEDNTEEAGSRMKAAERKEEGEEQSVSSTLLLGSHKKETLSSFERQRQREQQLMQQLEDENVGERPWYLRGEVLTEDRPQNSALEEHLEYDVAVRHKPVITEDTTARLERLILGRIRLRAWDDVERKVKPNLDPYEYKKKLLLEQDKSKKSLAQIYEEEYLKKQQEGKEEGEEQEELQEHKEIKQRMEMLFLRLDGLSNYHYTPALPSAEVKVQSNLPAITLEEATPATTSDASLLAPQEVLAPVKGQLKGATERTQTDRKRERRTKKVLQKKRSKAEEARLREKLKKTGGAGGGGKLDAKSTMKVIQKAVKTGQVKLLDGKQAHTVKSSQTFFKQLQENKQSVKKTTKGRKKEAAKGGGAGGKGKKRKKQKEGGEQVSVARLLL